MYEPHLYAPCIGVHLRKFSLKTLLLQTFHTPRVSRSHNKLSFGVRGGVSALIPLLFLRCYKYVFKITSEGAPSRSALMVTLHVFQEIWLKWRRVRERRNSWSSYGWRGSAIAGLSIPISRIKLHSPTAEGIHPLGELHFIRYGSYYLYPAHFRMRAWGNSYFPVVIQASHSPYAPSAIYWLAWNTHCIVLSNW